MQFTARLDRTIFSPDGGRRHLWVRLSIPRTGAPIARPPLDIALVLDRSGSMSGQKIALAREAAKAAARVLRETDRCALIAYDDQVDIAVPAGPVDADHRDRLARALDALDARGSTDLFGGWTLGAQQVSDIQAERLRRVILLTDGLANVGVVEPTEILRHVRELNVRGIGTSTFGVGRDFDEDLVSSMAEAGGGHFYFIEQPRQIPDFLASELGELLSVVARDVQVSVRITGTASVHNINDLPLRDGHWQLGDISELAEIDLLFAIEIPTIDGTAGLPTGAAAGHIEVTITVDWIDATTRSPRSTIETLRLLTGTPKEADAAPVDNETIAHVVKTRAARVRHEALKHNKAGDYDAVRRMLAKELGELEPLAANNPGALKDLAELRDSAAPLAAPMDAMDSKRMHMASYSRRHSRPSRKP